MAESTNTMISHPEAAALAKRLSRRGAEVTLAEQVATMETDSRTAGRLIRAMLRQTHSSDVFHLPPETEA